MHKEEGEEKQVAIYFKVGLLSQYY